MRQRLLWILLLAPTVLNAAEKTHELCRVCHSETVASFLSHAHSQEELDCDTCHGESVRHRTSQGHSEPDRIATADEIPSLCGNCHQGTGTVSMLSQYSESKHGRLVLAKSRTRAPHCGTCHGVHDIRRGKSMERQCRRCHSQLPASCEVTKAASTSSISCSKCHAPHTLKVAQSGAAN